MTRPDILSKSDLGEYEYDATFKPHAVVGISSAKPWLPTCTQTFAIHPIGRVQSISDDETHYHLDITYGPDLQRCKSVLTRRGGTVRKTVYGGAYENTVESGVSREFYYLDGNVIVVKTDGIFTPYLALTDNLGSYLAVVDSLGNKVFNAHYDAWGCQHDVTANSIKLHRGYCGHEMLNEFKLINMNARLYSPYVGRFLAPDNYVQAPDHTQSFNRYSYCLNNPLKYVDPDGNFWHIVIGAAVGGALNLWGNWDNCDGFWQICAAFCVGAGAGAAVAATGGTASAGLGSVIGVSALGGAGTAATNDIIRQTGRNFSGFEDVNWKTTGKNALIGGVASSAGSAAGYWASNASLSINDIAVQSPILRSAIASPIAAGAGHVASGTTEGLLQGNSLGDAFTGSLEGIGTSMAIGGTIGVTSTMATCYATKISPWTGERIQRHHSFPKALGGEVNQKLTPMSTSRHQNLHKEMNQYLKTQTTEIDGKIFDMYPRRGNSGRAVRSHFMDPQRFNAVKSFYDRHYIKYFDARYDYYKNNGIMKEWRPW